MSEQTDHIGTDLLQALSAYDAAILGELAQAGFDDVSASDLDILGRIPPQGGAMGQIAAARGVTKQAIQGQVQSLMRRGYLTLISDPDDARVKRVTLTKQGDTLVATLVAARTAARDRIADKLGVERAKNMRNMLVQVRSALQ